MLIMTFPALLKNNNWRNFGKPMGPAAPPSRRTLAAAPIIIILQSAARGQLIKLRPAPSSSDERHVRIRTKEQLIYGNKLQETYKLHTLSNQQGCSLLCAEASILAICNRMRGKLILASPGLQTLPNMFLVLNHDDLG